MIPPEDDRTHPFGCQNPRCPGTREETTATATPPPKPDASRPILALDALLDRIAAQSHFEDRYEVREQLSAGGMGAIYAGYDRIIRREVAIKMSRPEIAANPAGRGHFVKEAIVGGRLLHPNILPVFDLGVNHRRELYFTMRLVAGASLDHTLKAVSTGCDTNMVTFPLRRVVEAFRQACCGVDFAHQKGVLHLDLKPANMLVSTFNEVFVIDWGLARVDDEDDSESLIDLYQGHKVDVSSTLAAAFPDIGPIIGTPGFMAPEQARGALRDFSPVTDVYGLGGILYYILYERAPNEPPRGGGITDIMKAIALPKRPGTLRNGILLKGHRVKKELRDSMSALEKICLKALQVDPGLRHPSAEELIIEVNEWLATFSGFHNH